MYVRVMIIITIISVTKVTVLEETFIKASKVINGHSFMH